MLARICRRTSSQATRSYTTTVAARPVAHKRLNAKLIVGAVAAASLATVYYQSEQKKAKAAESIALDSKNFVDFRVAKLTTLNHNTKVITLALDDDQKLGLSVASCVTVKLPGVNDDEGKPIIRPYTPLDASTVGFTELLIKKYNDGKLTPHIHALKVGDVVQMKGPIVKYQYTENTKKKVGLIAGGTGLTPMLQVADAILKNPNDKTEVTFVFANIAEEDILMRKEIDERAAKYPNFKVHYVLEKPPADWTGSVGYVSKDTITKYMPSPSNDNLIMVCGPPPMMKAISGSKAPDYSQGELDGLLKALGYTKDQVFKF